jgi:hypothetical protein
VAGVGGRGEQEVSSEKTGVVGLEEDESTVDVGLEEDESTVVLVWRKTRVRLMLVWRKTRVRLLLVLRKTRVRLMLVLRKTKVRFETLVLRETIVRFERNQGWSCDYSGWLCDYDNGRTPIKVVTNIIYYSFRINTILSYCKIGIYKLMVITLAVLRLRTLLIGYPCNSP